MADNYIERTNIQNVKYDNSLIISSDARFKQYKNMLNNVSNMLKNEGPVLSTWIKFQVGISDPIVFDSSSTNPKKNLIASLSFNKTGAGVTNDFKLVIQYDPFNMGQETADVVEELDEYIAKSMSCDIDTEEKQLRGKLMYGYNAVSDSSVVSPEYTFYITNATTEVRFDSGISTYIFEGCSVLGADCDNVTTFPKREHWKVMDIVEWTLYYWYGTKEFVPAHTGDGTPTDNPYKYKIEISDEVFNNAEGEVDYPEVTGMTPLAYCQKVLDDYPLTKAESESGKYTNLAALNYLQKPRYLISVDDANQSIIVTHIAPLVTTDDEGNQTAPAEKQLYELDDFPFYWGKQSTNLVVGWKPEADTKLYLIRRAQAMRLQAYIEGASDMISMLGDDSSSFIVRSIYKSMNKKIDELNQISGQNAQTEVTSLSLLDGIKTKLVEVSSTVSEMYNAQLQLIGIPADPPIGMAIRVMPTILETVSRTAGVYIVVGAKDEINTNGLYISTLDLFRIRGLNDYVEELKLNEEDTNQPEEWTPDPDLLYRDSRLDPSEGGILLG